MTRILVGLVLAVTVLLPGAVLGTPVAGTQPRVAAQTTADSTVTQSGAGEFAGLRVSVSKTTNLINESVTISWTGAAPTVPAEGYRANFLQIMQCWGDDPNGPDRTQCQFGAIAGEPPTSGPFVRSRQVDVGSATGITDPAETLHKGDDPATPEDESFANAFVPFWAAGRAQPPGRATDSTNDFFDNQVTNEIPIARTRADGTGEVVFEVQTAREGAGLGCGAPTQVGGQTPRNCWLVIVPRGITEADGSTVDPTGVSGLGLQTSPLSPGNFKNKIAFPLTFRLVGSPCPLGSPERHLYGHELVVDAISSWQPALCAHGGALYGLTQLSDDLGRGQLLESSDPGLTVLSAPIPPDQERPDRPVVYAPIAVSALTFAFDIEKQPPGVLEPGDPRLEQTGAPFTELKLTPRLVAKLLTQSYRGGISSRGNAVPAVADQPAQPARMQKNPLSLTTDPEFLELNPEYGDMLKSNIYVDGLVQSGTSDLTGLLWDWVLSDKDARDFVAGTPDPSGMVVNELNKGLTPPIVAYPRNDQTCGADLMLPGAPFPIQNCTGDEFPFADDMHAAGRAASRGDPLGRLAGYDPNTQRKSLSRKSRQPVTQRALIAVVDVATAQRYKLPTATVRNAAGNFVAPDETGLRAGLAAMKPSAVPGVLQPDPATTSPDAYPLTALSYAATSPPALTETAGHEYAAFLRFAAGDGQRPGMLPGQLPAGYLPLTEPLRAQTLDAATVIETEAGKKPIDEEPAEEPPGGTSTDPGLAASTDTGNITNSAAASSASADTGNITAAATGSAAGGATGAANPAAPGPAPLAPLPPAKTEPVATVQRTPSLPAPAVGTWLMALLIGGGLAAALAPVTHLLGTRRSSGASGGGGETADRAGFRRFLTWPMARPAFFARRR